MPLIIRSHIVYPRIAPPAPKPQLLPRRSPDHIKAAPAAAWSAEHTQILVARYLIDTPELLAAKLGRSLPSIYRKAMKLGLTGRKRGPKKHEERMGAQGNGTQG